MDETLIKEFAERVAKLDPANKLCFEKSNLQEYDTVELTVEKSKYAKYGLHKGMIGTILDPEKNRRQLACIFLRRFEHRYYRPSH